MRFMTMILAAFFCLSASADNSHFEKASDEALIAAAERLLSEEKEILEPAVGAEASATKEEQKPSESAQLAEGTKPVEAAKPVESASESEIPLVMSAKTTEKSENHMLWRLLASLGILLIIAGGLVVYGRKYARHKDKGGQKTRIEIMHQLNLGPKRSVALIRVAGEAVLIGVTDHNVSMLKTVTLIDDELEGLFKNNINGFLEDEFTMRDMRAAIESQV